MFAPEASGGGFSEFYETYLNYPGFEAWKFFNLFVFVGILVYFIRKPLGDSFKQRREAIRVDLVEAQKQRDAATAKLEEAETRLQKLDTEAAQIKEKSLREAEAEAVRITEQTQTDVAKLRENATREVASATQNAKQELKKYSAEESIKLAEDIIRKNMNTEDANRLVTTSINGLGGATK